MAVTTTSDNLHLKQDIFQFKVVKKEISLTVDFGASCHSADTPHSEHWAIRCNSYKMVLL